MNRTSFRLNQSPAANRMRIFGFAGLAMMTGPLAELGWAIDRLVPQQFATVQAAVDAAGNGDVVVVSAGEYVGSVVISGKAVTIRGVGEVTLDASASPASVVRVEQTPAGSEVRLENLRLRGGLGTELSSNCWPFGPSRYGGGLFVSQGRVRLAGVNVQSNQATLGGGIWYQAGSRVEIDASLIDFNTASEVGAAVAGCWISEPSELIMTDSTLSFNALVASGGRFGIVAPGIGSAEIRGTTFENNNETLAMIHTPQVASTNLTITDSIFRNNTRLFGSVTVIVRDDVTQTLIERCVFEDETGPDGSGRGGVLVLSRAAGSVVIRDCDFARVITNAVDATLLGGGNLTVEDCRIRNMPDGAMLLAALEGSQITVRNVQSQDSESGVGMIVSENGTVQADRLSVVGTVRDAIDVRLLGGRVELTSTLAAQSSASGVTVIATPPAEPGQENRLTLRNVTLAGNFIGLNPQASFDGEVDLVNCIVAGNLGGNLLPALRPGIPTIRWSLIEEVLVPAPNFGPGIINEDPRFVDPAMNDYRLAADSPAIDAGDVSGVLSLMTLDLDGQSRRFDDVAADRGAGGSPLPDLGAFERQVQVACSGADVGSAGGADGGDGVLDNNDFVRFIQLFFDADARADLGSEGAAAGQDGSFDNNDFVVFIGLFFAGC